ncbi:hypothetical protein CCAX7_54710 [Capsulimonas corticalis]|uniref:Uncharacterized protein n=1 Tax=Capsulimonas corticalis TaxID=2219043 RepID=A0A402D5Q9_9BACT|nr:hypothetical protein [Capsulimonas corticalis]BDI33420.1 hypothetical protein CCAX7_54710 [Capsulimonas corticalis]
MSDITVVNNLTRVDKFFNLKAANTSIEDNYIDSVPSVMGVMDEGADVIFPGAFTKSGALESFLKRGFVPTDHKWEWTEIVAMPISAKEDGNKLVSRAVFHTTQKAQDARTICMERLAQGLWIGESVGFGMYAGDYKWFASGQALLTWAEANGYDLSLFDADGIKSWKTTCRGIINIPELYEYSIVPVGMNRWAEAVDVKSDNQKSGQITLAALPALLKELSDAGAPITLPDGTVLVPKSAPAPGGARELVAIAKDGKVTLKGEYLGDIEIDMTLSAAYDLCYTMYYIVAAQLRGNWSWDDVAGDYVRVRPPLADALVAIEGAAGEFTDVLLRVIEAIMSGVEGAQDAEEVEVELEAMAGGPDVKQLSDSLHAGESFQKQLGTVRAAVKSCSDRAKAIHLIRVKEGRALSETNRQKLTSHRDALADCVKAIDDLLEETKNNAEEATEKSLEVSEKLAPAASVLKARRDFLIQELAGVLGE